MFPKSIRFPIPGWSHFSAPRHCVSRFTAWYRKKGAPIFPFSILVWWSFSITWSFISKIQCGPFIIWPISPQIHKKIPIPCPKFFICSTLLLLCCYCCICWHLTFQCYNRNWLRADSRFAPSQWETSLQSNAVSHWLGANLKSALWLTTDSL